MPDKTKYKSEINTRNKKLQMKQNLCKGNFAI